MHIRIMSWNIKNGAMKEGRWPGLATIINSHAPDILALQECAQWLEDQCALAQTAEQDLGMCVHVGRNPGGTGDTAIAYRPRPGLSWDGMEDHLPDVSRGYSAGRFNIAGLPVPLVVISAHISPYSDVQALIDTQSLVARARRYGGLGIIAGDFNHPPIGDPEPDWSQLQPHNRMVRAIPDTPETPWEGSWRSNTAVAKKLLAGEMIDAAGYLADLRGDPELRASTGVHGRQRVDRFHVVRAMQNAITDYYRVNPEGFSDHYGIVMEIDLARVDSGLLTEFT